MNKIFRMTFVFLLMLLVFDLAVPAQTSWKCVRPSFKNDLNEFPNVKSVTLDKEVVDSSCGSERDPQCSEARINVQVVAEDMENDVLSIHYMISGGKILGKGRSVIWDLSGEAPGIYWVAATADDGAGPWRQSVMKRVEVKASPKVSNR